MSDIDQRVAELRDLMARLEDENLGREEIARIAAQCAELAGRIVAEAERLVRRSERDG